MADKFLISNNKGAGLAFSFPPVGALQVSAVVANRLYIFYTCI